MDIEHKKHYNPQQLLLPFDLVAPPIPSYKTTEVQNGTRQPYEATGHSAKNSVHANNSGSIIGIELYHLELFDLRQMGIELTRKITDSGTARTDKTTSHPVQPTPLGTPDTDQRISFDQSFAGDDSLRDTEGTWNRDRAENYRISHEDALGVGGPGTKLRDNLDAIKLLKHLQSTEAKNASLAEKKILVRYVGWGGLPQAFDPHHAQKKEYQELRNLLTEEEYAEVRRSTQDAHFTSDTVIKGMYQGLERLGVIGSPQSLRVLEPSAGIGNFIGLLPEKQKSEFVAIELDSITSAISRYLYPQANHLNRGFQHINIPDNYFDLTIGNPPFGRQSLFDPSHPELNKFSIHNYFLAKSIAKLRNGGIAAFVVSRYFLDAVDSAAREHIAAHADFLGAIRLPSTAFAQNALTEVTTDIVFFQKKAQRAMNKNWLTSEAITIQSRGGREYDEAYINTYFIDNPEQIIGKMVCTDGAFQGTVNCLAENTIDLASEIKSRIEALPSNIYSPRSISAECIATKYNEEFIASRYFASLKMGAFCVEPISKKIVFKSPGPFGSDSYKIVPLKNDSERQRLTEIITIRDALRTLIEAEKSDAEEAHLEDKRQILNQVYDNFVKKFGFLNSTKNRSLMREEPEHSLLESLEISYDSGISPEQAKKRNKKSRAPSAQKATIFQQRVLRPSQVIEHAETSKDALIISLYETGKVNFTRMAQLTGHSTEDIEKELQSEGLIFLNPATEIWEIRDKYLTGNVREKLGFAQSAAKEDPRYCVNVNALQAAMPPDIEAIDIGIKFGTPWVPSQVFSQFMDEIIHSGSGQQTFIYVSALGKWEAKVHIYDHTLNTSTWGIPEFPATDIIQALMKNTPIKVEKETGYLDDRGKPIMTVDQELTAAAMQKGEEIKQAFLDWVWLDDTRRKDLSAIYNERFNTHIPPRYDGSHIELIGASSGVMLRPHQKNIIWRSIQEGTALFDHVVGAGKTLACIATIMESRRMGFIVKPMIVVPNHLLHQWKDEFYRLYPSANILVAEKTDFIKQNRECFFSQTATGSWDAVIVPHSSFKKIDMPKETQKDILSEQIEGIITSIQEVKKESGSRTTVKQLEKQREVLTSRYEKLLNKTGTQDQSVDFSDLGIDALFVDESHEFKNLGYATTMNVAGLGNTAGSGKALDLFVKCRYLQRKNNGRGVYFMTGTPISNSISEVYTLQRYLQYDELSQKNIGYFDAWAATFGQITNGWELDATGTNYKLKSRFASFQNVPEPLAMYRSFADVVTKNDLDEQMTKANKRPLTPSIEGGAPHNIVLERSPDQATYMANIISRMENLPRDSRQDNPLKITNDARKAGLDFRMIDITANDFTTSKINVAVDRIYNIWQDTRTDKGTQLVFCDLSTPKGSSTVQPERSRIETNDYSLEANIEDNDEEEPDNTQVDMDVFIANGTTFSVYDDIKQKLVSKGIPHDEIAFIHDANTDLRKAKLFADMQNGLVRVLLGSTAKMGAGMNVQKKLVAAHHLDAPWRPSDLEQRNGRILRQGNEFYARDPDNFKVKINYYATKQTYDARMWQTIEYKAAAIEQFRKGDLLQRVIDDVTSEAANAAEMKAAASGNPLILSQVQLAAELRKLEALFAQHVRAQHRLRDRQLFLAGADSRFTQAQANYEANIKQRDANTHKTIEKGRTRYKLNLITDRDTLDGDKDKNQILSLLKILIETTSREIAGKEHILGTYRGFQISIFQRPGDNKKFNFSLKGANNRSFNSDTLSYTYGDPFSLSGFFQRIDNILDKGLDQYFKDYHEIYKKEVMELKRVMASINQEFPQMAELVLVRDNHAAILRELTRMQNEPEYISNWQPKTLTDMHTSIGPQ